MKTIVIGIGNTLLTDDGVGVYVARELALKMKDRPDITVIESFNAGLELIEKLTGYDRAILIDSIFSEKEKPGQVLRYTDKDFRNAVHLSTYHDMNFPTALALYEKMGIALPKDIIIIAVTVEDILTLNEACTPKVAEAIPLAVNKVLEELNKFGDECYNQDKNPQ
jgi:hydrogenase maturation protease